MLQSSFCMDPASITKHYSSLCATQIKPIPTAAQLNIAQCKDLYGIGLTAAAAAFQQQIERDSTRECRTTAVRNSADWLQTVHAASNRTLHTVIPEDILMYLTQDWLPKHADSDTKEGEPIAAPSRLSGVTSHLESEFEQLGRIGDWDSTTQKVNSMHSTQIRSMLKDQGNHAAGLGYQKRGAVCHTEPEMRMLLSIMHNMYASTADEAQMLLLLCDGLLFNWLWHTCFRGFNAGGLRLYNIVLPTGGSAAPYLVPIMKLPARSMLHLLPDTTKSGKGEICSVTWNTYVLCLSTWLQLAIHLMRQQARPSPT